jgi:regulator of protease activity HflC (stomatin/prohibitin superfamily)
MEAGFGFLGLIGWGLIAVAIIYVFVVSQARARGGTQKVSLFVAGGLVILGLLLNTLSRGLVTIPPNERGIVLNAFTGIRLPTLEPGVHFIAPFIESVKRYSTGQATYTMSKTPNEGQVQGDDSVTARTSDGQEVFLDASVTYRVDTGRLPSLLQNFPTDNWEQVVVRPRARSIVYNRVATYRVEEVYSTKREELQKRIEDDLRTALDKDGLILEALLLRNITFNQEYAKSVEEKQVAQQNAERAKFVVDQERQEAERIRVQAQGRADAAVTGAKGEAESQIIRAEAEAKSLELIAKQIRDNPSLLTFRYIEKLTPGVQTIFLPANQPFLLDPKSFIGPVQGPQPQPQPQQQQTQP